MAVQTNPGLFSIPVSPCLHRSCIAQFGSPCLMIARNFSCICRGNRRLGVLDKLEQRQSILIQDELGKSVCIRCVVINIDKFGCRICNKIVVIYAEVESPAARSIGNHHHLEWFLINFTGNPMLDIYFSEPSQDSTDIEFRKIYMRVYTGSVNCVQTREQ